MRNKKELRSKRKVRIRAKIVGTSTRPRLSVYRSNTALYAQVIDDTLGKTLVSHAVQGKTKTQGKLLGTEIAKKAKAKKITTVVFDRGGYRYHGAIKEVADGAREGGLKV